MIESFSKSAPILTWKLFYSIWVRIAWDNTLFSDARMVGNLRKQSRLCKYAINYVYLVIKNLNSKKSSNVAIYWLKAQVETCLLHLANIIGIGAAGDVFFFIGGRREKTKVSHFKFLIQPMTNYVLK